MIFTGFMDTIKNINKGLDSIIAMEESGSHGTGPNIFVQARCFLQDPPADHSPESMPGAISSINFHAWS